MIFDLLYSEGIDSCIGAMYLWLRNRGKKSISQLWREHQNLSIVGFNTLLYLFATVMISTVVVTGYLVVKQLF